MRFNIVLIQPMGYTHSLALLEVAEYFQLKISKLGYGTALTKNRFDYGAVNILIGAHLLKQDTFIPERTIIFNSEQFGSDNTWTQNESYLKLLSTNYVWDYSPLNINNLGVKNASVVNFVYESKLDRINRNVKKDIDLLFYGSINARREVLLKDLSSLGIKCKTIFNLYSKERDSYIERSKSVLNLHYYDAQVFQQIRCFYPMTNGVPVFSEDFPSESAPILYQNTLLKPNGADFVQYVASKILDGNNLHRESQILLNTFRSSENSSGIREAIDQSLSFFEKFGRKLPKPLPVYKRISLDVVQCFGNGCLNISNNPAMLPDIVMDFGQNINFPFHGKLSSGAEITIQLNYFDEIFISSFALNVDNFNNLMNNCMLILREGGTLKFEVPYDLSLSAWGSVSPRRAFNQNSWFIYDERFWDMGWFNHKFKVSQIQFKPSGLGKELLKKNASQSQLLSTPRAVDSMSVILTKTRTNMQERTLARSFLPGF